MYFYRVLDEKDGVTVYHEKKFSNSEFKEICNSAPRTSFGKLYLDDLLEYLEKEYGFKKVSYSSYLNIDLL